MEDKQFQFESQRKQFICCSILQIQPHKQSKITLPQNCQSKPQKGYFPFVFDNINSSRNHVNRKESRSAVFKPQPKLWECYTVKSIPYERYRSNPPKSVGQRQVHRPLISNCRKSDSQSIFPSRTINRETENFCKEQSSDQFYEIRHPLVKKEIGKNSIDSRQNLKLQNLMLMQTIRANDLQAKGNIKESQEIMIQNCLRLKKYQKQNQEEQEGHPLNQFFFSKISHFADKEGDYELSKKTKPLKASRPYRSNQKNSILKQTKARWKDFQCPFKRIILEVFYNVNSLVPSEQQLNEKAQILRYIEFFSNSLLSCLNQSPKFWKKCLKSPKEALIQNARQQLVFSEYNRSYSSYAQLFNSQQNTGTSKFIQIMAYNQAAMAKYLSKDENRIKNSIILVQNALKLSEQSHQLNSKQESGILDIIAEVYTKLQHRQLIQMICEVDSDYLDLSLCESSCFSPQNIEKSFKYTQSRLISSQKATKKKQPKQSNQFRNLYIQ